MAIKFTDAGSAPKPTADKKAVDKKPPPADDTQTEPSAPAPKAKGKRKS